MLTTILSWNIPFATHLTSISISLDSLDKGTIDHQTMSFYHPWVFTINHFGSRKRNWMVKIQGSNCKNHRFPMGFLWGSHRFSPLNLSTASSRPGFARSGRRFCKAGPTWRRSCGRPRAAKWSVAMCPAWRWWVGNLGGRDPNLWMVYSVIQCNTSYLHSHLPGIMDQTLGTRMVLGLMDDSTK